MKIKAEKLLRFVNKATLGGTISSMVIKGNTKGLEAKQKDLSNIALSVATIKCNGEDMELCIKDTNLLINMLKSFTGDIEIKKNENIMSIFNENRQVDIVLSTPEYIDCNLEKVPESLETAFDVGFETSITPFKNIVEDMKIVKSNSIIIEVKDKMLNLTTGAKDFDNVTMKVKTDYNDAKSEYCDLLAKVIAVIDDKFNLSFKNDFPLEIKEKSEDIEVRYIVAPLTEKD